MNRVAVIIGINGYGRSSGLRPLRYAERDAESLAQALRQLCGFTVIVLCGPKATREGIENALDELPPADLLLVFFAGHAMELRGEYHLFPSDSSADGRRAIAWETLWRSWYRAKRYRRVLAVLDACRDTAPGQRGGRTLGAAETRDINAPVDAGDDVVVEVLYGCRQGQCCAEYEELGHGLFTYALLVALKTLHPREVDTAAWADRAADTMGRWCRGNRSRRLQTPCRYHAPGSGRRIVLAPDRKPAAVEVADSEPVPVVPAGPSAMLPASRLGRMARRWQRAAGRVLLRHWRVVASLVSAVALLAVVARPIVQARFLVNPVLLLGLLPLVGGGATGVLPGPSAANGRGGGTGSRLRNMLLWTVALALGPALLAATGHAFASLPFYSTWVRATLLVSALAFGFSTYTLLGRLRPKPAGQDAGGQGVHGMERGEER